MLFVCWYEPHGIATVYENVAAWQRLSRYELEILNLWPTRSHPLTLPATLDLGEYDGLIIHAALAYAFDNLNALDARLPRSFEQYDGVKLLMKQDEHRQSGLFAEYLGRKRFDVLLSCVPQHELPKVYPRERVGSDLAMLTVLTGYVTEEMRGLDRPWSPSRPIDIGYRGSIQPLSFGRLGFEKRKIGDDVARALAGRSDLRLDISSRWEDRISGPAWIDFIASSKATLGVESGSNLFDFDGSVEAWCREFEARHPEIDRTSEEFYRLADQRRLWQADGNVDYAQISPRHFEAAAARSVQILYEGRYSDIFAPYRHYLPLRRDLANLDELVETLLDERRCAEITECAFAEIICSPDYGYEAFVARVDDALDAALERKRGPRRAAPLLPAEKPRALLLTGADPAQQPRFGWLGTSVAADFALCEIGTYGHGRDGAGPSADHPSRDRLRLRIEPTRHETSWVPRPGSAAPSPARQQLVQLAFLAEAPEAVLRTALGALDALSEDFARFHETARRILNTSAALLEAAQRTGRFDIVVATDLDSLPAGRILRDETGARLVCDLADFVPFAAPGWRHWEIEFWSEFVRSLVAGADLATTASPPLAQAMTAEFGCEFAVLPNCAPLSEMPSSPAAARPTEDGAMTFRCDSPFAAGGGVERLIAVWAHVGPRGRLQLCGRDGDRHAALIQQARSLGLLDRTVFFVEPPDEDAPSGWSQAEIGIIAEEPVTPNNRLFCPAAFSRYLACGLPVVCNDLPFLRSLVEPNRIGYCTSLAAEQEAAALFNRIIEDHSDRAETARRARDFFTGQLHWEIGYEPFRARLLQAVSQSPLMRGAIDIDWVHDPAAMRRRAPAEAESARLLHLSAAELDRLRAENPDEASSEMSRLVHSYAAEIVRLNQYFPTELTRQRDVYTAEIAALNREIDRLHDIYKTEIARLIGVIDSFWWVRARRWAGEQRASCRRALRKVTGAIRP